MIQTFFNILGKILLSPLALLYGFVVGIRSFLYRSQLLKSSRFDIPIISVGNLNVGGSGKSPHIEYLIKLLLPYIQVSVLSRGYKRKTEGFRIVEANDSVLNVGDEPLQFKTKYPSVSVAVGEKRAYAIPQMLYQNPTIQTILLDDAFQHLAVKPYLNILLTEFSEPFTRDFLLPAGRLRDWRSSYHKADIVIVTKCPTHLSLQDKAKWIKELNPYPFQRVYFSYYEYGTPYRILSDTGQNSYESESKPEIIQLDTDTEVLLVCAIAKADYLVDYLSSKVKSVTTMKFEDHRLFSNYDIAQFKRLYDNLPSKKKVIITTEKDVPRLLLHKDYISNNQLIIYALPIEVNFLFGEKSVFDEDIKAKLLEFKI